MSRVRKISARSKEGAYYFLSGLLTLLLVGLVYGANFHWIRIPISYEEGDGLLEMTFIKNGLENFWYHQGHRLAYPEGLNLAEYPFVATINFLFLKFFNLLGFDYVVSTNLYYILTFVFCTWTMFFLLRRVEVTPILAMTGGILFSFLPYHFDRNTQQLWLSAYYGIPLVVAFLINLISPKKMNPILVVASGCIIGLGDLYYSYYTLFLLLITLLIGFYRKVFLTTLKSVLWFAVPLAVCLFLSLAPFILNLMEKGSFEPKVLSNRDEKVVERYSLLIVDLFIPRYDHPLKAQQLSGKATRGSRYLGLSALVGFIILLLALFRDGQESAISFMAKLNVAAVLFSTVGGLSALLGRHMPVFLAFRANYRMSVFIACLGLAALFICLNSLLISRRRALGLVSIMVVSLGWFDQAYVGVVDHSQRELLIEKDKKFFENIEKDFQAGSAIAQWPTKFFPEGGPVLWYTNLIPFLSTTSVKWSYGSRQGSLLAKYQNQWNRLVEAWAADKNPYWIEVALQLVLASNFKGLLINRQLLPDIDKSLEFLLTQLVQKAPSQSNERFYFFDLSDPSITNKALERYRTFTTKVTEDIEFSFQRFFVEFPYFFAEGWARQKSLSNPNSIKQLILISPDLQILVPLLGKKGPTGSSGVDEKGLNSLGFEILYDVSNIPKGNYKIGIRMIESDKNTIVETLTGKEITIK